MLATYVPLHDIRDAEGFVARTIQNSGIRLEQTEREELVAEGLTILCDLAGRFDAHRPGYATCGRFSGYAAQFLPRRLGDAWHRAHPEHRYATDGQGGRQWIYDPAPLSIDGEETAPVMATAMLGGFAGEDMPTVQAAIERIAPWARFGAQHLVELLRADLGWDEIAAELNMTRAQVADLRERLERAIGEVRGHELEAA